MYIYVCVYIIYICIYVCMLYMHFRAHAILCAVLVRIHVRAQGARARADTFARFVSGYLVLQIRGTTVPRQPDGEDVRGKRARGRGGRREGKGLIAMPLHCRNPVRLSPLPACKHRWRSSTSILRCSTTVPVIFISFLFMLRSMLIFDCIEGFF